MFCTHKPLGFAVVVREFYTDMVEMKEDSMYVKGVWVPMGHKRFNEMLQIKDPKNGSKYKKLLKEPNYEKIVNFLTVGKEKWSSTRKNPHKSINRGSLTEEAKVWFYFIASVIIPTKHLSTIREQEVIIFYALLKGYKFNAGKIIETIYQELPEKCKKGTDPPSSNDHSTLYFGWSSWGMGRGRNLS